MKQSTTQPTKQEHVENQQEIKDEPKAYGKNVVSVYLTQGARWISYIKNEDKYHTRRANLVQAVAIVMHIQNC